MMVDEDLNFSSIFIMRKGLLMKQIVKKIYRDYIRFTEYKKNNILTGVEGNSLIYNSIKKGKPLMVTRIGSTELEVLSKYVYKKRFTEDLKNKVNLLSGVYPPTDELLKTFSETFLDSLKDADIIGVWFNKNEGEIINKYCKKVELTELRALEPYYWDKPWSKALENKTVLVIHPFEQSIIQQFAKREKLFVNEDVLPNFNLRTIKAVQSAGGNLVEFESWVEALNYMYGEIDKIEFDIAIIGAGAYGLPLASYIKRKGKQAVHMGGASQILFGIKGVRWDNHPVISKLYNEYWIRPDDKEKPRAFNKIENGCYW